MRPRGLEIVTVALDAGGAAAAGPWIEAAAPDHPSLIDAGHELDALLGVVNVPSGTWIDEQGVIVRPPEPAFPDRRVEEAIRQAELPADATARQRQGLEAARAIRFEPERTVGMLRDWVDRGAASRFALDPAAVLERSRPRPESEARAAAHFALARRLHDRGEAADAIEHFREAMRLHPDNWTYRRQAFTLLPAGADPRDVYGTDWLDSVLRVGPEAYYPPLVD